jgi:hypothetical protein
MGIRETVATPIIRAPISCNSDRGGRFMEMAPDYELSSSAGASAGRPGNRLFLARGMLSSAFVGLSISRLFEGVTLVGGSIDMPMH